MAKAKSCASSRGAASIEAPVHFDTGLRPGLAFMTLHFPDDVETNILTIDAMDPKSGTAEFKATAIRVEKLGAEAGQEPVRAGADGDGTRADVDLHLIPGAVASDAERDAIDRRIGAQGRRRGTCCCRRCTPRSAASARSARAR